MKTLTESICSILLRRESTAVSRPDPSLDVWHVARPGLLGSKAEKRNVDSCKHEILRALTDSKESLVIHHVDSPIEEEIAGTWISCGESAWKVPADVDLSDKQLEYWLLSLGNWRIYPGQRPVQIDLNPFRCTPAELMDHLAHQKLAFLIDVWADGDPWIIGVGAT